MTGAASSGVPTHHDDAPRPGSHTLTIVRTAAPTAAGLKTCRPCHASRYFDADATAPASASPARPSGSRVGRRTKSRMSAVMSEDSRRQDEPSTRWATASTAVHTALRRARLTMSSSGPIASAPRSDSVTA